jgi:hypothetical protein
MKYEPKCVRKAFKERFPRSDARAYFAYVEKYGKPKRKNLYCHHICPKCEFPKLEKEPWNQTWLTWNQHKEAHRLLTNAVPESKGFRVAALHLFNQSGQAFIEGCRRGGVWASKSGHCAKIGAKGRAKLGYEGICKNFEKGRKTQAAKGFPQLAKARVEMADAGWPHLRKIHEEMGLKGMRAQMELAHKAMSRERRLELLDQGRATQAAKGNPNMARGNHVQWHLRRNVYNPKCKFCRKERKKA